MEQYEGFCQIEGQLESHQFKTKIQFVKEDQKLNELINYLNWLKPSHDSKKIKVQLAMIEQLIKFYGTPILICFQNYYNQLKANDNIATQNEKQIKNIASLVKGTTDEKNLEELKFFSFLGTSRKKYILNKSLEQKQFLGFIFKLSSILIEMQKKVQRGKTKTEQAFWLDINNEMTQFLESDIGRQLNVLEQNYQNYFKSKATAMFKQIQFMFQDNTDPENPVNTSFHLNKNKPEQLEKKSQIPICCRTFFFKNEIIPQPQNLRLQYKNYVYPFKQVLMNTLKKTFCGFLNNQGGIIFIGISEDNQNKKRVIQGGYYNENVKEDILKIFRKVAESIVPQIITNKLYNISFVPIKKNDHQYISGCYVIKIVIRHGARDDLYSYKNDEGLQLYAFRTENEVIHRSGRQVLNALRQRIKNPLPIPQPNHEGMCAVAEVGKPIHYGDKIPAKYQEKKVDKIQQKKQSKRQYRQKQEPKKKQIKLQKQNKQEQEQEQNKDWNYLALNINEIQLKPLLKKWELLNHIVIVSKPSATYLKIDKSFINDKFLAKIGTPANFSSNVKFLSVTKYIKMKNNQKNEKLQQYLIQNKIQFKKQAGKIDFYFKNIYYSIDAFIIFRQHNLQPEFVWNNE